MIHVRLLFVAVVLGSLLTLSCGKVTQAPNVEKENKSFNLTYSVSVLSTANYRLRAQTEPGFSSNHYFSDRDNGVYAQIMGVDSKGKMVELSWGRAVLFSENEVDTSVSPNVYKVVMKSRAFRKDGIKLTASDSTWTYLNFNNGQWNGDSKKIDRRYPYYFLTVFASPDKYYFKVFSDEVVSDNATVSLGEIDRRDTLLGILFLNDLRDKQYLLTDTSLFTELNALYDASFFNAITYINPRNTAKKFDVKNPYFKFKGDFETHLDRIWSLVISEGETQKEAITYIDKLDDVVISADAKAVVKSNISSLNF